MILTVMIWERVRVWRPSLVVKKGILLEKRALLSIGKDSNLDLNPKQSV